MRFVTSTLCLVLLSVGHAGAQEAARARAGERAAIAQDEAERGLESIAGEAAEVEADDRSGLGTRDDGAAGGMSTVEDELIDAENTDGCTGAIGALCRGGDN